MDCNMPGFPVHHQLPKLTQTQFQWVGDAIQPSHLLLSASPPTFNLSWHPVFLNELFALGGQSIGDLASASVLPMNIQDWFPLGWTGWRSPYSPRDSLKSLLQHHSSKASILRHSAFFIDQFSYPYMTTEKTIVLTRWIFFGKVISLLFNMLCRLVITFLPRSKCLIISWLQLPSVVILELKRIKSVTVSTVSPSICVKWWDWMPQS